MLKHSFIKTALASLAITVCSTSMAADNYGTKLNKLKASPGDYSWIKERSIENIDFASMVLCILNQTGANHQDSINAGPYVAKVTAGLCDKNTTQTSSAATGDAATGVDFEYYIVDTKRSGTKLDVKLWIRPKDSELADYLDNADWISEIHAHVVIDLATSSQIGFDELHWVHLPIDPTTGNATSVNFSDKKGYGVIIPTKVGNDFQIKYANKQIFSSAPNGLVQMMNIRRTGDGETTPITMTGFTKSFDGDNGQIVESTFKVAANRDEFVRREYVNGAWNAPVCYDRNSVKFNTWDYALFDADTKEPKEISGSVDISLTQGGTTYRGNYRMSDMWLPEPAVNAIGTNGAGRAASDAYPVKVQSGTTIKDGTLTMKHGGLRKVTNSETTLAELAGAPFNVWVCTSNPCVETLVKWTGNTTKFQYADGVNKDTSFTVPAGWGDIWLSSNGVGYRLRAPLNSSGQQDWTLVSGSIKAISRIESRVSDTELAALSNTALNCVAGCPVVDSNNSSRITGESASNKNGVLNASNGSGFSYKVSADGQLKLWNGSATVGSNLVVNGFIDESTARSNNWSGTDGFSSGALIVEGTQGYADFAALHSYFECAWNANNICGWNKELPSNVTYYTWRTGKVRWDKEWELLVDGHTPTMQEPIMVSYTCPTGRDCEANSKYIMRYEGGQRLNGIPNRCVSNNDFDVEVNCNTSGDKQWLNRFNLTRTSATANADTDFVTDVKTGKKYLVLPQGSMEYYAKKNSCSLTTDVVTEGEFDIDTYFRQSMVEIGAMPIDILKSKVIFQDGRPTKSMP